jgi:2TM domain
MNSEEQIKYDQARKRVKEIKGFYTHFVVYLVVNVMIFVVNIQDLDPGETYFQFKNFTTAFFWGLGLLAHALSVFVPSMIMGKNWEERKIKELMDKDKNNKWE